MNNGFCVILTKDRLYQGIALYRSLIHNVKAMKFNMYILCIDEDAYSILKQLNLVDTTVFHISEIAEESLIQKKIERRANEFCWTMKPVFLQFILDRYPHIDRVTYLDADLCFFSDPAAIFFDAPHADILLTIHDFVDHLRHAENDCGRYNSGFISFRRSPTSENCLRWWKENCLIWCYDRTENGKFGDQKYLDLMPHIFSGVSEIKTPGVNIAPWNQSKFKFSIQNSSVYVNNSPLIFYHFCGLRIVNSAQIALTLTESSLISIIHTPYFHILNDIINSISAIRPGFQGYFIEEGRVAVAKYYPLKM